MILWALALVLFAPPFVSSYSLFSLLMMPRGGGGEERCGGGVRGDTQTAT